jgi:putative FmdB family regulatory protein
MIYTYKCRNKFCGHIFDREVSLLRRKTQKFICPKCMSKSDKIISYPAPIVFKGDGFTLTKTGTDN